MDAVEDALKDRSWPRQEDVYRAFAPGHAKRRRVGPGMEREEVARVCESVLSGECAEGAAAVQSDILQDAAPDADALAQDRVMR
jgi:hypothetical protein